MRCEVVAVGTELLLGQIVDTNSAWIGERLARAGIDCHFQTRVGDNIERIVVALQVALGRSDAVVVCGGLGPTPDDVTREALSVLLGVPLVRDDEVLARIRALFAERGRAMASSNERQAEVPVGAAVIEQRRGTAPGLICPVGSAGGAGAGGSVIYAVPGVPREMTEMVERAVVPDLQARMGQRSAIVSRVLRVWGEPESALAERLAPRLAALDAAGNPTIAFLASGIDGIQVRITAKATTAEAAGAVLDAEEAELRSLLGEHVFGVDDQTMESAVAALLRTRGLSLGLAESMTGGLIASRLTSVPGASTWFRGGVVSYAGEVKFGLLGVPPGPVVSEPAARAMAEGARRVLGADVGLAVTGVAGPGDHDGVPAGTVVVGVALAEASEASRLRVPGDRVTVTQLGAISALDVLRRRLLAQAGEASG
ncbi:MAG TPA: competence/damage-inducible protein A [Acidimicrobiales bacterium]|nr:competence/damage-inducible protein A [Acidimicrobiales bacterium]